MNTNTSTVSLNLPFALKLGIAEKKKMKKIFFILSFMTFLFLSVFYIFQTNAEVSEKYALFAHEKEISDLIRNKESMEVAMARQASLGSVVLLLENSEKGFVKAKKVYHIKVVNNQIVSM
ncbi:MAG: hypothetical protein WCZ99_03410 [Candidatus Paceibacterota bacterium]|jgi:hypothetical protein|nr:hypothetical protein [Candidatus Paceibacterota bacterium]